jgi:hypothetical protein
MKSESWLWAKAAEMIDLHGADACIFVGMEADAALVKGDLDKLHEWRIILRRVPVLLERTGVTPN